MKTATKVLHHRPDSSFGLYFSSVSSLTHRRRLFFFYGTRITRRTWSLSIVQEDLDDVLDTFQVVNVSILQKKNSFCVVSVESPKRWLLSSVGCQYLAGVNPNFWLPDCSTSRMGDAL